MKTAEQVVSSYKSDTLDGRDLSRLARFLTEDQCLRVGLTFKDEFKGKHVPEPLTRDNVIAQLREDVAFGFEKALGKRGISAGLMAQVVQMWNWILEEGLEGFDDYPQYGLPIFKATALKYGFPNPIGDDFGKEGKYASD